MGEAIGVALAQNTINDGNGGVGTVTAYIIGTPVQASGLIDVEANSAQTIHATTAAAAVAVAVGGTVGAGASGAGVSDLNVVAVDTSAYISGGTTIGSGGVKVVATDASGITALVGAASVAAGFGGTAGVGISIGLSMARNTIDNAIAAYVTGVGSLSGGGDDVSVTATENDIISATSVTVAFAAGGGGAGGVAVIGGGATANNIIGVSTDAYISSSSLTSVGKVTVKASETGSITAFVAAASGSVGVGGAAGVGVSIGASIANNSMVRPEARRARDRSGLRLYPGQLHFRVGRRCGECDLRRNHQRDRRGGLGGVDGRRRRRRQRFLAGAFGATRSRFRRAPM